MEPWPDLEVYSRIFSLDHSRLNLFFFDTGESDKPVCILLHGLGDEADSWRHVIPPLSRTFRVITPDLPGFGRSDKPKIRYTIPFLSRCILELMDALSIPSALFMGNSMGGMISQWMALRHPDKVSRLVLADGLLLHAFRRPRLSQLLFLTVGVGEYLYSHLENNPEEAFNSLQGYYANLAALPEADRAFLFRRVNERVRDRAQRYAFFSLLRRMGPWIRFRQKQFRKSLKGCSVPTLVLWGEEDFILPVEDGRGLTAIQETASFVTIGGSGHLPHQEQPDRFLHAFTSWLEDHPL